MRQLHDAAAGMLRPLLAFGKAAKGLRPRRWLGAGLAWDRSMTLPGSRIRSDQNVARKFKDAGLDLLSL